MFSGVEGRFRQPESSIEQVRLVHGHYVARPNVARPNVARPNVAFTISVPMLPGRMSPMAECRFFAPS
jgi:hypothetical protein